MKSYEIISIDEVDCALFDTAFPRLSELGTSLREAALIAWASMLASSPFTRIEDVPFSHGSKARLVDHTNDVVEAGLALFAVAADRWGWTLDRERLLAVLLLHDLDKPLLMDRREGRDIDLPVAARIPHGVLGAMMLAELGVDESVVAAVATHATHAPLRGPEPEIMILHYADLFSADAELEKTDRLPFYRR